MNKEEKMLRELLKSKGYDVDELLDGGVLSEKERKDQLASIIADIIKNQNNNSTKIRKVQKPAENSDFYLGFISDTHSKLYLLENYLKLLDSIGGKCVVTGDVSNGSNHFHGHDSSLKETLNLTNDILAVADTMKRYPDMFIGYVEGNHDQWITEGTSLLVGHLACKIAGVDEIYAKNIEIVTQNVVHDGKLVPFNFLLVHGEGMPFEVTNALKKSLEKAAKQNVDAIIFGHTHKMGSATLTLISQNGRGDWSEKQVTSFNPGTIIEAADYADKVGYPANTPFDGSVLHCSVAKGKDGKNKKVIDLENIMNVVSQKDRDLINTLNNKLSVLEAKKYQSKEQILGAYTKLVNQYSKKGFSFNTDENGNFLIGISGTSDMYSPSVGKAVKAKIKEDIKYIVSVAKDIPNLSIVLNGDLIYDYNKGYIAKKDYCADTIADIQDLCGILKPISDKIVAINSGKMEDSIMSVERDKCNGRLGGDGKKKLRELANYASQVLQLNESEAYAPYDKAEMHSKQLAIQNNMVNDANQIELDRAYSDYIKKQMREKYPSEFEDYLYKLSLDVSLQKKVKEGLVKELRDKHKILDISNADDKRTIDRTYPLSNIDLREPNKNLIGNIFAKFLGIQAKNIKINSVINSSSQFKIIDKEGKTKLVSSYYCTSLSKFLRELPTKLMAMTEIPDVVLINNYVTKAGTDLQEFTTQLRMNYITKRGAKKSKDVLIIDSGSFAYSKYMTAGKVPANMLYKVVDVEPIYKTLIPKDSVNFAKNICAHPVVEKYHYESVLQNSSSTQKILKKLVKTSAKKTLNKFDEKIMNQNNNTIADQLTETFK